MQQISIIGDLRSQLDTVRKNGKKIVLVPTMGNLHPGHLSLVEKARQHGDYIVVTIFVNPTQFNNSNDLSSYPRTLDQDLNLLGELKIDMVFTPEVNEIYPPDESIHSEVTVPELDSIYCGKFRPGHFKGVATVVTKLFNIIQPDAAVFGEKDYQQLLVIRSLVRTLNLRIEIISAPTIREKNGLAMSSRNQYLNEDEKQKASLIYKCLSDVSNAIKNGEPDFKKLENEAMTKLDDAGFKSEYFNICDAETLKSPKDNNIVVICAAWLGEARLIDNVALQTYD